VALKGSGGKLSSPNKVYRFLISDLVTVSADSGGLTAGSLRYGDPSLWSQTSTLALVFERFRVVKAIYTFVPTSLNAGTGGSGIPYQSLVVGLDPSINSVTYTSTLNCWSHPTARLAQLPSTNGGEPGGSLKHALMHKIVPEQQWFDIAGETQRGCVFYYGDAATVSVGAFRIFAKYIVEFSGLLV